MRRRRYATGALALAGLLVSTAWAQPAKDPREAIEALRQAAFLQGRWCGEGWVKMGPASRRSFTQTTIAELHLDGALLIFEAIGHTATDPPRKVHHVFVDRTRCRGRVLERRREVVPLYGTEADAR